MKPAQEIEIIGNSRRESDNQVCKFKNKLLKKLIVELDLSNADEYIREGCIREILVVYYNFGEGIDWVDKVPFKILKAEYIDKD